MISERDNNAMNAITVRTHHSQSADGVGLVYAAADVRAVLLVALIVLH